MQKNLRIPFILLILIAYFPVFWNLGSPCLRFWDESVYAINAIEAAENGHYIMNHFDGKPDFWNTKPPLVIWKQAILIKLFGINELSVRLPSAFAGLFTMLFVLYFFNKDLKEIWLGFAASLVLITTIPYLGDHGIRYGDFDSSLTLYITISVLYFYRYLTNNRDRDFFFFVGAFILATLTKGVSSMMFLPGMLICLLLKKQFLSLIKTKKFYIAIGLFIATVGGLYLVRELLFPGYLKALWINELGGRYTEVIEGHAGKFNFYINYLTSVHKYWFPFLLIGIISSFGIKNKELKDLSLNLIIMMISYFLIISVSSTKLVHYLMPIYPIMAIISAIPIFITFSFVREYNSEKLINNRFIPILLIIAFSYNAYIKAIGFVNFKQDNYAPFNASYLLRDAPNQSIDLNNTYILHEGYQGQLLFYIHMLREKNIITNFIKFEDIKPGQKVLVHQDPPYQRLKNEFDLETIYWVDNVAIFEVINKK